MDSLVFHQRKGSIRKIFLESFKKAMERISGWGHLKEKSIVVWMLKQPKNRTCDRRNRIKMQLTKYKKRSEKKKKSGIANFVQKSTMIDRNNLPVRNCKT